MGHSTHNLIFMVHYYNYKVFKNLKPRTNIELMCHKLVKITQFADKEMCVQFEDVTFYFFENDFIFWKRG